MGKNKKQNPYKQFFGHIKILITLLFNSWENSSSFVFESWILWEGKTNVLECAVASSLHTTVWGLATVAEIEALSFNFAQQ